MAIQLNASAKLVEITAPTTTVTVQELVNAIRDWEDELGNLSYPKVIDAVGKADLGGSVYTAITMTLLSTWQIEFWSGVNVGYIKDGTVVAIVGNPVKGNGADTIIINNQVGGVIIATGSGVTPQDKIDIIDGVWDEDLTGHSTAKTAGWFVKKIKSITDAILAMVT